MNKEIPPELIEAFAELAQGRPFTITPVRICDHCQNEQEEAFPYGVEDATGKHWDWLCNNCFDALKCSYNDSYPVCQTCGSPMEWEECGNGCEDGYFWLYEEDPLWYYGNMRSLPWYWRLLDMSKRRKSRTVNGAG